MGSSYADHSPAKGALRKQFPLPLSDRPRIRSWAYTEGIDDIKPVEAGVLELHDLYQSRPELYWTVTVPTLWDRKTQTIVNNESAEIIRMLNSEFDEFAENDLPDLYPVTFRALIDELNDRIYKTVNNGVYRCGFAKTQEAYDEHIGPMFETFDHLEELLKSALSNYQLSNRS